METKSFKELIVWQKPRDLAAAVVFLLSTFYFLFSFSSVSAAILYLDPVKSEHYQNETFLAKVRVDTQGECINVLEAALTFPNEILEVVEIGKGGSVVAFWTKEPTVSQREGLISFVGGMPGGYCGKVTGDPGQSDLIFSVFLKPNSSSLIEKPEIVKINFLPDARVLLNDGFATKAKVQLLGSEITLLPGIITPASSDWEENLAKDNLAPEPFTIALAKDPSVFGGKWFAAFQTIDYQTGIDYYELKEGNLDWKRVQSPYLLQDQSLKSVIKVKAVDKAGNERIAEYKQPRKPLSYWMIISILFGSAIICWALIRFKKYFPWRISVLALLAVFFSLVLPLKTDAAFLILQPSSGAFSVDSTFNLQILLDTEGQIINALDINLTFPPDKLQVVSPSVGKSIIGIWVAPPKFDNAKGTLTLQGGIPEGITVSKGLVSTVTFRVRGTGTAVIRIGEGSRILLHDGKGTDALYRTQASIYNLVLPAPAGPEVVSETHPDQTQWYDNPNVVLSWSSANEMKGFSYTLNDTPVFAPDEIIDSEQNSVIYKNLTAGNHYFHIKAINANDLWGGVTHFAVNVDTEPPADFQVEVRPSSRTTSNNLAFSFFTTDKHSGIARYEYKLIPLSLTQNNQESLLFVETQSQQVVNLEKGSYDIIVRAYDMAGNFREVQERVRILSPFIFYATNVYILTALALLVLTLLFVVWKIYARQQQIELQRLAKKLPSEISEKLKELDKYRNKYGKLAAALAIAFNLLFALPLQTQAQTTHLAPPFVSTFPRQISNEEIFYIGGRAQAADIEIIIYVQSLTTGETFSYSEISGKNGEWFYRHPSFLSQGEYIVWTQSRFGDLTSPPSPQITLSVNKTAMQLGSSRLSYETLWAGLTIILFLALAGLIVFALIYSRRAKHLRRELIREIREAEEAVKRGFSLIAGLFKPAFLIIH